MSAFGGSVNASVAPSIDRVSQEVQLAVANAMLARDGAPEADRLIEDLAEGLVDPVHLLGSDLHLEREPVFADD